MNRRHVLALPAAVLFASLSTGCPLSPDIEFDLSFAHDVDVDGTGTMVDKQGVVDLYAKSPDLMKYRSKIESVSIDAITVAVVAIAPDNRATKLTGKILVGGVEAGATDGITLAADQTASGIPSAALNKAIVDAVKKDGKLAVAVQGTSDAEPIRFSIEVRFSGTATASPL